MCSCILAFKNLALHIHVFQRFKKFTLNIFKQILTQRDNEPMYLSASFINYQHLSILSALFSPIIFIGTKLYNFLHIIYYINNILKHFSTMQCFCSLFVKFIHVFINISKQSTLLLYRISLYEYTITYLSIAQLIDI